MTPPSGPGSRTRASKAGAAATRRGAGPGARAARAGQEDDAQAARRGDDRVREARLPRGARRRHRQGGQDVARHLLPVLRQQGRPVPHAHGRRGRGDDRAVRIARRRSAPTTTGSASCANGCSRFADIYRALRAGDPGLDRSRDRWHRVRAHRHRRAQRLHPHARRAHRRVDGRRAGSTRRWPRWRWSP